jgi:hypothetical protein
MKPEPFETTIVNCARCEGDHDPILMKPLTNPSEGIGWYAICPTLNEPIIVRPIAGVDPRRRTNE